MAQASTPKTVIFAARLPGILKGLDPPRQVDFNTQIEKLQRGLDAGLHALEGVPFAAFDLNRKGKGAYRAICHWRDDTVVVLHVGPHDDAYAWAQNHQFEQVGNVIRLLKVEVTGGEPKPREPVPDDPVAHRLFQHITDNEFWKFEVRPLAAEIFRQIPDVETLEQLIPGCSAPLAEALTFLGADPWAIEEAREAYWAAKRQQETTPLVPIEDAVKNPVNASEFVVAPVGFDALQDALNGDFEAWRTFLHPSQQRLVKRDSNGAMKVTGGPGTGKTVVALHRAVHLLENVFVEDDRPLLLTTFSNALASQLEQMWDSLTVGKPDVCARAVIQTVISVGQSIAKSAGEPHKLLIGAFEEECWSLAMDHEELGLPLSFYQTEREFVVGNQGLWSEAAYVGGSRRGRPQRLNRAKKVKVWRVIEAFENACAAAGYGDQVSIARNATRALRTGVVEQPYCAVVCDEVQDVSAAELRMLAAMTAEPGTPEIRSNALFMVGDGFQRLYQSSASFKSCGIPIVGRSHILRLNYRTTDAIRQHAVAAVKDIEPDDLDSEATSSSLRGYRSLRAGVEPERQQFSSFDDEVDFIALKLSESPQTLILARTNKYLDKLKAGLAKLGHDLPILGRDDRLDEKPAALCSLHRSKGLEAPSVIIAGMQLIPLAYLGPDDESARKQFERSERCALYVGMTRARDRLLLTSS